MSETIFGLVLLFLIMVYFIVLSIKLYLIGQGKIKDIYTKKYVKSTKKVITSFVVIIPSLAFAIYILYIIYKIII